MHIDDYLSVLNKQQLEAVKHEGSPLLILAGAGSGKTRVITTKIAYLISEKQVDPYRILALTFTKKAANEMAERAREIEPFAIKTPIRTFHSFGAWFLRNHYEEAGIDKNFTVYDDDDMVTLLTKAIPSMAKKQASFIAHQIALCKDYGLTPDSPDIVKLVSDPDFPSFYKAYQKRLKETGNVDFGDLILMPVLVLQEHKEIREHMYNRFHVIMVDEYQDSNVAQFLLVQQLCGPDTYIGVVGDDDQSIYKFRGAEIQNILTFQDHFPKTKIIKLERNYRSSSQILKIASDVVSHNTARLGKTLVAERGEGKRPKLIFLPNQDDETKFCSELIEQAHEKGCPYAEWAVLYRTNAQSLGFETEFLRRKIPYEVVGSLKFYQREEIKDILAWLSFLANPRDEIAFRRIINKPSRGIGGITQDKIIAAMQAKISIQDIDENPVNLLDICYEVMDSLSKKAKMSITFFIKLTTELAKDLDEKLVPSQTINKVLASSASGDLFEGMDVNLQQAVGTKEDRLSIFIEKLVEKSGLGEYHSSQDEIAGTQRVENLQELCNSAVLYPCNREGLLEFLDHIELDRTLEFENGEVHDAVTLITLHNTKGLEFSRVIITGMEKGVFPRRDKTEEELEEERRLCYVGITRAREELYLTCCDKRRMYGKTDFMEPSPFLLEIESSSIDVLGNKPRSFDRQRTVKENLSKKNSINSISNTLAEKWHKGVKIYHDEWGYGAIINTKEDEDEYVITVQFETGAIKHFMPQYQAHSLMICKD